MSAPAGRTALVVGGSSAIGSEIAVTLAGLGYDLVLWGRDPGRLERAVRRVVEAGARGAYAVVEVRDRGELRVAAERLAAAGDLAVVVWAAGVFDFADVDAADPDRWDEVFDVNLAAAAYTARLVMPALLEQASSALVLIGSAAARQAFGHNAAYVSSKHGLRGLAEGIWLDVRDRGVKVSLLSPGLVAAGAGLDSPAGVGRPDELLQPSDVAAAVAFVVGFPGRGCPVEIRLEPQRTPG